MGIRSNHPVYSAIDAAEAMREELNQRMLSPTPSVRGAAINGLHNLREMDTVLRNLLSIYKTIENGLEESGE